MNRSFDKDTSLYGLEGSRAFIEECRQAWVTEDGDLPILSKDMTNALALLVLAVDALGEEVGGLTPSGEVAKVNIKRYPYLNTMVDRLLDAVFEAAAFQIPFNKAAEQAAEAADKAAEVKASKAASHERHYKMKQDSVRGTYAEDRYKDGPPTNIHK